MQRLLPAAEAYGLRSPGSPLAAEAQRRHEASHEGQGYCEVRLYLQRFLPAELQRHRRGPDSLAQLTLVRLAVLRSVLAEVTNAAKTSNPMKTDVQMLGLLRKRTQSAKEAISEFQNAKRDDLAEKEQAQVSVLEEYASTVKTMGEDEITQILQTTIGDLRTGGAEPNIGQVSKELYKPGGALDGKTVDRAQVVTLLKGML